MPPKEIGAFGVAGGSSRWGDIRAWGFVVPAATEGGFMFFVGGLLVFISITTPLLHTIIVHEERAPLPAIDLLLNRFVDLSNKNSTLRLFFHAQTFFPALFVTLKVVGGEERSVAGARH